MNIPSASLPMMTDNCNYACHKCMYHCIFPYIRRTRGEIHRIIMSDLEILNFTFTKFTTFPLLHITYIQYLGEGIHGVISTSQILSKISPSLNLLISTLKILNKILYSLNLGLSTYR